MLQPLKPVNSTGSTEATEATDSVRPISEQRPGNTLQDRLYRKPEITGSGKLPEEKGNATNLFQQYSIAKFLPATPVAPASDTANFQATFNKFGNYQDFWGNLVNSSKTPEQPMVYQDKGGIGQWFTQEEADLRDKYMGFGQEGMEKMVKSQLEVNKRLNNRFYEDLTKEYDTYSKQDPIYQVLGAGSGGTLNALTGEETKAITDIAKKQGLGQRGYEALLDQAYTAKSLYHAKSNVEGLSKALADPDKADWASIAGGFGISPEMTGAEALSIDAEPPAADPGQAGIAFDLAKGYGLFKAGLMGVVGAVGTGIYGAIKDIDAKKLDKAKFNPIKNGKLVSSINDFSGSERRNLEEWANQIDKPVQMLVDAIKGTFVNKMVKTANFQAKDYDTLQGFISSDKRLGYGDKGIKQTQQYVKGQGDLGYYSPEYWGSYKDMFNRRGNV